MIESGRIQQLRRPAIVLGLCFGAGAIFTTPAVLFESARWQAALNAQVVLEVAGTQRIGPPFRAQPTAAVALLNALPVRARVPKGGYRRNNFGAPWSDVDGNGCDTRNDVLRRDLNRIDVASGSACLVSSGVLADPYTGAEIDFRRGRDTSGAVQIDHVVALADAWQKGAQQLQPAQRLAFANDPLNLIAVDGPANMKKSDADAAVWLPPNQDYRCAYVARQISVKAAYALWVTEDEKQAMAKVLGQCMNEPSLPSGL